MVSSCKWKQKGKKEDEEDDGVSLEGDIKVDHESDEAADALYWTGGVPYELDLLWK